MTRVSLALRAFRFLKSARVAQNTLLLLELSSTLIAICSERSIFFDTGTKTQSPKGKMKINIGAFDFLLNLITQNTKSDFKTFLKY